MTETAKLIAERLSAPFPPEAVGWKPAAIAKDKTRALAVAYIDARDVMDRLDDVVGIDGWQDEYVPAAGPGTVQCMLRVRIGEVWITKMDVGSESGQDDVGDRVKSAFSDALKRAAVKFGIGRYLYSLPMRWYGWNEQKREFAEQPTLPAWAIPKKKISEPVQSDNPKPAKPAANGQLPKNGEELLRRLTATEDAYVGKVIAPHELLNYIRQEGMEMGYSDDIAQWNEPLQIKFAWFETIEFLQQRRACRITPAQQRQIEVACKERWESIEERAAKIEEITTQFAVDHLKEIPAGHFSHIMMKLREFPVRPVTASAK